MYMASRAEYSEFGSMLQIFSSLAARQASIVSITIDFLHCILATGAKPIAHDVQTEPFGVRREFLLIIWIFVSTNLDSPPC